MKKFKPIIYSFFLTIILSSCGGDGEEYQRDRDPWVFRSVLDEQPRMITAALHEDLYVAYDARNAGLYKAWKGGVNFDGAVYTSVHGPQPTAKGYAYFVNKLEQPQWILIEDGNQYNPKVNFRSYKIDEGQLTLTYELTTRNGEKIIVTETPEYIAEEKKHGLQRVYSTANVPEGVTVGYETEITSLEKERDFSTTGDFQIEEQKENIWFNGKTLSVKGTLLLNSNDETDLTVFYHPGFDATMDQDPKMTELVENEEIAYAEGKELIFNSDCKTCHNEKVQTIGPAYQAVAEKYEFTEDNVAMLASKVQQGGSGVWGEAVMNAHPDLSDEDAQKMIRYIMSLDGEVPAKEEEGEMMGGMNSVKLNLDDSNEQFDPENTEMRSGLAVMAYKLDDYNFDIDNILATDQPILSGVAPIVHAVERRDIQPVNTNVLMVFEGFIDIPETSNYVFRLVSDDGSLLYLKDRQIIDNSGFHGPEAKDGEVYLQKGQQPIKVYYYQGSGGATISLQWAKYGDNKFSVVPADVLSHRANQLAKVVPYIPREKLVKSIPGDQRKLEAVHPSFTLSQARPDDFQPRVGGMDFMSDGALVVCTWDSVGGVYTLKNVVDGPPEAIEVTQIASGLAEPLGLKVVEDTIYVLQKQELTKLVDNDGDGFIDEYVTHSDDWEVSANFHEFSFGLEYQDGYFYGALAIAILPGGASAQPQIPDRGKVVKISRVDGSVEFIAHGLRTPNGVGEGVNNDIFIADNQGDWLPSSKIIPVKKGAFYGSRAVDFEGTADLEVTPPVVWLPQDEIGNSPTTPSYINVGPYNGQMIHGEVTHGGVKRVYVEQVDGTYQGAVFRFIQGLEAGVNRLTWGPDGSLYVGGVGSTGNWQQDGKLWYGIQKLTYNGNPVFEPLAVRARSNGLEIEFTEPIGIDAGRSKDHYQVKQWYYEPTENYGGPKLDEKVLTIQTVNISEDCKKIFLELEGMKEGHVLHFRIVQPFVSENDRELWTTEAWYTMNKIPQDQPGFSNPVSSVESNTLTKKEKEEGWKLLFDGETTDGWRNFQSESIGSAWKVSNGTLYLDDTNKKDWQIVDGGDIMTDQPYDNYILELEWMIEEGGNSGVIYHVQENDKYDYVWQTGPEMQILDNVNHPDGRIEKHRSGDLYDMIETKFVTVNPPMQWNKVRLVSNNGKMEHWLNGYKVVEYNMNESSWEEMIENSKFSDMPGFGKAKKGHIALQDHGDKVWFRNIKIKEFN